MRISCIASFLLLGFSLNAQDFLLQKKGEYSCRRTWFNKAGTTSVADVARMNKYDVHFYKLDLEVKNNVAFIRGNAAIHARVDSAINEIVLQLHPAMIVDSIILNDIPVTYSRSADILTISSASTLNSGDFFRLIIYYQGTAPVSGSGAIGNGFSNVASKKVTWSLSQPNSAYEWWPCKQVLTDKADSSEVWITTDSVNKVGSNGVLKNKSVLANGKVRYEWKSHYPIDYYLISLTVCPYEEYNLYAHPQGSDSILIQNYIYKNATPDVKAGLDFTPSLIETFSLKFGSYPFADEKYGHCQAEVGGGMEHQTMTTLGVFDFWVIAHELGHQWFGDFVTCGSWSDIWLNEGFASYSEYISMETLQPESKQEWIKTAMDAARQSSGSVYVLDSFNVGRVFDYNSSYKKGAILLHMLRYEINNDSLFFLGLRNYLQAHRYNTSITSDFKAIMQQTAAMDFNYFFDEWFYNPGYPVFSATWNQVNQSVMMNIRQSPSTGNRIFKTSLDIQFRYTGGDTVIRVLIDSASNIFEWDMSSKKIYDIRFDPDNRILKDVFSIARNPLFNAVPGVNGLMPDIVIFPNPAREQLTISGAAGFELEIFSITGLSIMKKSLNSESETLDLGRFSAGFYIARLTGSQCSGEYKFIKE